MRRHALQIHGGSAYLMITRLGRILRCANQSNRRRVERSADFIHRPGGHARLGMEFKEIYDAMMSFSMNRVGKAGSTGMNRLGGDGLHAKRASAKRGIARFSWTTRAFDLAL
jgi:hypothetical protein